MAALFADLPELIENSVELAKRCNLELSFGKYFLPAFPVPAEHTLDSFIRENARAGLVDPGSPSTRPRAGYTREDYERRLETELDVIVQMGFPGYFLIVADFINWAKQHDIPVGPGRGSGAGSLVAYALGITDLDPLRYDLLFERFLNPERVSLPDFDVDFCMDRRDEVIDYVAEKYGRDRVSQIITYGTMAAKAVLRDTGRVLGMPYGQVDRIAKLLPKMPLDLSLEDALGRSDKSLKEPERVVAEFKSLYASDEEVKELVDLALKLEDLTRNAGRHAGGVVIAPGPLSDYAPIFSEGGGEGLVTQFDKDDVEAVGLVKFDFLGLRTLTIIDWAVKAINQARDADGASPLDIAALPTDDAASTRCSSAATRPRFSSSNRAACAISSRNCSRTHSKTSSRWSRCSVRVRCSRAWSTTSSRASTGARTSAIRIALLEPILKPTYGVIVYQEQVMQIAQVLAGYSLGGADLLRRAMGKKKAEEMALAARRVRERRREQRAFEPRLASSIFDLMEKFAEYGFNKSHSAAYALVAYQTAWLKAHYPAEFMAAVLSSRHGQHRQGRQFPCRSARDEPHRAAAGHQCVQATCSKRATTAHHRVRPRRGQRRRPRRGRFDRRSAHKARRISQPCRFLPPRRCAENQQARARSADPFGLDGCARAEPREPDAAAARSRARGRAACARRRGRTERHVRRDRGEASIEMRAAADRRRVADRAQARRRARDARPLSFRVTRPIPGGALSRASRRRRSARSISITSRWRRHERRGRFSDQPYTIAGQVIAIRKRGDAMAFVQVEDWSGRIEVSLFREAWIEYGPLLTRDAILVFDGGLSLDEFSGSYQLRVNSVATIESACERPRACCASAQWRERAISSRVCSTRSPRTAAAHAGAPQFSQRERSGRDRARRRMARARGAGSRALAGRARRSSRRRIRLRNCDRGRELSGVPD